MCDSVRSSHTSGGVNPSALGPGVLGVDGREGWDWVFNGVEGAEGAGECLTAGDGVGGVGAGAGLGASDAEEELDGASESVEAGRWKACRRARRLFRIYEG